MDPLKEVKVKDFDITTPIDTEEAIQGLGGDPVIFYKMLGNLETMSMNQALKDMVKSYDAGDND